ncbi:MAG: PIG-L family deacetylase [Terriglobia bacterium]
MRTFSNARGRLIILLAASLAAGLFSAIAQTPWQAAIEPSSYATRLPYDRGSTALWQSLMKLRTRASLLMIVAHPDDEDAGMLTYESRGQGVRVIMLTLNRGEGGQNVMSSAYWDELGVLRTQELLAADRYHGVRQYFTDVVDFGFSKTKEESFAKWGHQRLLGEVVRIVRMTRPLVITSVWVGGPSDGHGQHEVAGELAQEAFQEAGNPHAFPGQIRAGLRPWQPLKMYARVPFFSISKGKMYDYATRTWSPAGVYDYIHQRWLPGVPATNVTVREGEYNPILGRSFFRIAAEGLGEQKSQNGGVGYTPPGPRMARYHRYASKVAARAHESSFFDGIDTALSGIASPADDENDRSFLQSGLARIQTLAGEAALNFRADEPEVIAGTLAEGLKATDTLLAQVASSGLSTDAKDNIEFELRVKQAQFNNAILEALGVTLHAMVVPASRGRTNPFGSNVRTTPPDAIPGETLRVQVRLDNPSHVPLHIRQIQLSNPAAAPWKAQNISTAADNLEDNHPQQAVFSVTVPPGTAFTKPYFWRPNIEQPYYNILDRRYAGLPFAPLPLAARAELMYQDVPVRLEKVVQTAQRVRGEGTVLQPLVVSPAISVWLSPHAGVIPLDTGRVSLTVTIHSDVQGPANGAVRLGLPAGWSASPVMAAFSTASEGQNEILRFDVRAAHLKQRQYQISAAAEYQGQSYRQGFQTVGYTGLPPYNYYRPAECRLTGTDIKVAPGLEAGYIEGTGDRVPQSLENLGIPVHTISAQELATGSLAGYSAIVLGVRAYAAREDVRTYNARLLSYARNGGVLIVQYNTPEFDHDYGPYPYSLSSNPQVVVDENSPVRILDPSNPALRWPNKITAKDFKGWVEERGHGFMTSWDPRYKALVETHDPGQPPQKGGLLYARYGKGLYIYDALAFYRQLPEGVPGAYRLFANLVSLAKNPER